MGPFTGWPDEALDFYEGLEADNSKAYWDLRKAVYERAVKAPMEALVAELEAEFGPFKIMRPYRDLRFSADKTPYRTFIGAGSNGPAGVYVAFSAGGLYTGAGIWHLSRDQLVRYREAVDGAPGDELERHRGRPFGGRVRVGGRDPETSSQGLGGRSPSHRVAAPHLGARRPELPTRSLDGNA